MKLLLENWRKFLNERTTDQTYSDMVDFFVDAYTDPKNYQYIDDQEREHYEGPPLSDEDFKRMAAMFGDLADPGRPFFKKPDPAAPKEHTFVFNEPRLEDLHDQMLEQVPESETFFKTWEAFEQSAGPTLLIYYNNKEGDPTSDDDQVSSGRFQGGYYNIDEIAINFGNSRFSPPLYIEQFNSLPEEQIFNLLRKNASILRKILEHELTHMLNYARSGKVISRSKGIKRHHRRGKTKDYQKQYTYANSTEEIQARLIPIFKIANAVLAGVEVEKNPISDIAKLISLEVTNQQGSKSISNIVKFLFKIYYLRHPRFLEHTTLRNKRRISKRFYEFAEEILNR